MKFTFKSLSQEIPQKIASMITLADAVEAQLKAQAKVMYSENDFVVIGKAIDFAKNLSISEHGYNSIKSYLSHPFRVGLAVLNSLERQNVEAVTTAILHNIYEMAAQNEEHLAGAGFGKHVAQNIRLLTIDRAKEYDDAYLKMFYSKICSHSEELKIIRCMDKLDNLLGLQVVRDDGLRFKYAQNAKDYVGPIAKSLSKDFGEYFIALCDYQLKAKCMVEKAHEYEVFIGQPL